MRRAARHKQDKAPGTNWQLASDGQMGRDSDHIPEVCHHCQMTSGRLHYVIPDIMTHLRAI